VTERWGGETYRVLWEEAVAAHPDYVLITSWNEWHEGSEIEPSVEYGSLFSMRRRASPARSSPDASDAARIGARRGVFSRTDGYTDRKARSASTRHIGGGNNRTDILFLFS
jgi:hypothetical protein